MAPEALVTSRAAHIEQLFEQASAAIASDELRRSIDRLHAIVDEISPRDANGVVLLESRLTNFEKRVHQGLIEAGDQTVERNELARSLLAEADSLRKAALVADAAALERARAEQRAEIPSETTPASGGADPSVVSPSTSRPRTSPERATPASGALVEGEVVVRGEGLTLRLGGVAVVDDISVEVAAGQILAVVGRNGAGKSSLLRLLALDASATAGRVEFPFAARQGLRLAETRDRLGYLEQRAPTFTGRVDQLLELTLMLREAPTAETDAELTAMASRFGLADRLDRDWSELSGGYRTRFELARLLLCRPALLLLDEPLAALDPPSQIRYLETLRDLARSPRRPGVVITSQHVAEVQALADTLLVIDGGRVRYLGPPDELESTIGRRVFEYRGALDRLGVEQTVAGLGRFTVTPTGVTTRLVTEDVVSGQDVVRALADGGPVELFRDLSGSALVLLDEGAES